VPARTDILSWDAASDQPFLDKHLHVPPDLDPALATKLHSILHRHWDTFAPSGASRPMLGYHFCIDTSRSFPVACKQTPYGIHESPIIQEHIQTLIDNDHIERITHGAWLSRGLLAPKPHQEHIDSIDHLMALLMS